MGFVVVATIVLLLPVGLIAFGAAIDREENRLRENGHDL